MQMNVGAGISITLSIPGAQNDPMTSDREIDNFEVLEPFRMSIVSVVVKGGLFTTLKKKVFVLGWNIAVRDSLSARHIENGALLNLIGYLAFDGYELPGMRDEF